MNKYVVKVMVDGQWKCSPEFDTQEQARDEQNRILVRRAGPGGERIGVPAVYRVNPAEGAVHPGGERLTEANA